jgi:hypothetical protein
VTDTGEFPLVRGDWPSGSSVPWDLSRHTAAWGVGRRALVLVLFIPVLVAILLAGSSGVSGAQSEPDGTMPDRNPHDAGVLGTLFESLAGDAYEPGRWSPLPIDTLFSEGWDEPWVGAPNGQGGDGAPRQAWLNAYDGAFYRLGVATFGYSHDFLDAGFTDDYTSGLTLFTPLNRRVQLRWDIPLVTANRINPCCDYHIAAGDFALTPRLMLHESENASHALDVTFRMPTGDTINLNGVAAVTPRYNVWWNPWERLVVRGGFGFFVPFGGQSLNKVGARTTFQGNVAPGYYLTPHDLTPIGDMVWYASMNLFQVMGDRGPHNPTLLTITPGVSAHVGDDWYLLAGVEVPLTRPEPFDYRVLGSLMKVW